MPRFAGSCYNPATTKMCLQSLNGGGIYIPLPSVNCGMMDLPSIKEIGASDTQLAPTWRSGRDSNPRVVSHKLISSFARHGTGERKTGRNRLFRPREFGGVSRVLASGKPENGVGTSKNGMPGLGRKKTGFLEKCENGCKMSGRGKRLAGQRILDRSTGSARHKCEKKKRKMKSSVWHDGFFRVQILLKENPDMSKTKQYSDPLEQQIAERLAGYPDPMSRTDFRTACRIGTRTSLYLLQSGLVPCTHTGKKTRCYKIAKADVAEYLRRREYDPHRYAAPSGWYKNYPDHKPPATSVVSSINYEIVSRLLIHQYFEEQLADAPDVLTVAQIAQVTGYSIKAVSRWCSEGRLRSIIKQPKFMVPKVWLLDFLASNDYNNICRKSGKHYAMIQTVSERK